MLSLLPNSIQVLFSYRGHNDTDYKRTPHHTVLKDL